MADDKDLKCFSVHLFFKVLGAEMYNGGTGYTATNYKFCKDVDYLHDDLKYAGVVTSTKTDIAKMLKIPVENVISISYEEYTENIESEDEQ